jgi:hypothetical protein
MIVQASDHPVATFLTLLLGIGLGGFAMLMPQQTVKQESEEDELPPILCMARCVSCAFEFHICALEGVLDEFKNKIFCPMCEKKEARLVQG